MQRMTRWRHHPRLGPCTRSLDCRFRPLLLSVPSVVLLELARHSIPVVGMLESRLLFATSRGRLIL
jgi:hypothetical protein